MKKRGKLIVIEGTDGSGKATQAKILIQRLRRARIPCAFLDFPQYGTPSCGAVEKYLNGKYGTAKDVGPHKASIFFAVDRYDASFKLKKWLDEGKIVISNRYVGSNLAHQGSSINSSKKRREYFQWVQDLEYNIFKIPKPDLNIILFVPARISQKLVDKKSARDYLGKKKRDMLESDFKHLLRSQKVYKELTRLYPEKYKFIDCVKNNAIMSIQDISYVIWKSIVNI